MLFFLLIPSSYPDGGYILNGGRTCINYDVYTTLFMFLLISLYQINLTKFKTLGL